jgi:glycerophosphoryl diester phosphodiesterase
MIAPAMPRLRLPTLALCLTICCGSATLASAPAVAAPAIHAHRGGALVGGKPTYPENTLPAFRHAAAEGFVLELDVKLTEDRVPVVIHDATLDRVTPCSGEVAERTLKELRHCKVDVLGAEETLRHLPRGDPRRVPIPTLAQVLGLLRPTGSKANIEIKNIPTDPDFDSTPGFARTVTVAIRRSGAPLKNIIVQSFWPPNLDVAQQQIPRTETSLLTIGVANEAGIDQADSNGYDWVSPQWPVSQAYVSRAHSNGLRVVPYTVDAAAEMRKAFNLRVDALITNEPLRARRIFASGY